MDDRGEGFQVFLSCFIMLAIIFAIVVCVLTVII
jgi:hypothetical protein